MAENPGTKRFKRTDHEVKPKVDKDEDAQASFAFPDEMASQIFSYLPLKDRFRLETVCQQWQRCLYYDVDILEVGLLIKDGQYEIELGDIGKKVLSCPEELCRVLEKFQASRVRHLDFLLPDNFNDLGVFCMIAGIAANAEQVSISCCTKYENLANIIDLLDIIRPRVTSFKLFMSDWRKLPEVIDGLAKIDEVVGEFVYSLSRMERLKVISTNWPDFIFTVLIWVGAEFLPFFEKIELLESKSCNLSLWQQFKLLYSQQMKIIDSDSWSLRCDHNIAMAPWRDMQPFVNLEDLSITYDGDRDNLASFSKCLYAIAVGCPQLKALTLKEPDKATDMCSVSETEVMNLFMVIGKIKKLEELSIYVLFELDYTTEADIPLGGNISVFAKLENGTNIRSVFVCGSFTPVMWPPDACKIYGSFNQILPNVEDLDVYCMASELVSFVGLQKLKEISLNSDHAEEPLVIQAGLICLLKSCPSLVSVYVYMKLTEITEEFIRAIFEVAKQKMEKHMDLSVTLCTVSVLNNWQKVWDTCKHFAPRNLKLIFSNDAFDSSDSDEEQGND